MFLDSILFYDQSKIPTNNHQLFSLLNLNIAFSYHRLPHDLDYLYVYNKNLKPHQNQHYHFNLYLDIRKIAFLISLESYCFCQLP